MPLKKMARSLLVALLLLLTASSPTFAQKTDSLFFPETGHWVSGDFLVYYQAAADPFLVYGYPLTDAFQDPLSGATVQYFQRARFEQHMDATTGQRIQLSPLGTLLYQPGQPVSMPIDKNACRYFSVQKHYVCYAFLGFFDSNGGVAQFGNPISEIEQQDHLYIQYFERARLEWRPELPSGQRVALADLGRLYFEQNVGDVSLLEPAASSDLPATLLNLHAHAFVARAVVSPNEKQTLFVIVQDQYLRAVSQANIAVTVHLPQGGEERYRLPLTDQDGLAQLQFDVGKQPSNRIVLLDVEVTRSGLTAQVGTWFRIWW
ncbi:MAG: hypothetical protein PHQ40_16400 [Anaerolineaceae bacterium]|nr:hypothetical protein [Anaerolineaceae bacterium]